MEPQRLEKLEEEEEDKSFKAGGDCKLEQHVINKP
jgi:hypothetical protein